MNDIKGIIEDVERSNLVSDKAIKKVIEIIGQEEWNDIHDEVSDICTTTGELIITLKGIANLEKENAELEQENKVLAQNLEDTEIVNKALEKENAELKKANEWHFVKDGDLPVREDYYVIVCHSATGDFTDRCQWLNNEWWVADGEVKHFINEKVYAWKEKSQPPKESKS